MSVLNEHLKDQAIEDLSSELATDITAAIYSVSKWSNYIELSDEEIMVVLDSEQGEAFLTAVSEMILTKGVEL
jgi:hypothetical protein